MPVPGPSPIPALTQWLRDNRRGQMKLWELAEKLTAAGYRNRDGEPVTETTLRGWEAPSGGVPQSAIPYLERIFGKRAPTDWPAPDQSVLVDAIREQTEAIRELVTAIRDTFVALDARSTDRAVELSRYLARIAEKVGVPDEGADVPGNRPSASEPPGSPAQHRTQRGRKVRIGPPRPGWDEEPVEPELQTRGS